MVISPTEKNVDTKDLKISLISKLWRTVATVHEPI